MEAFAESRKELFVDWDSVERPKGLTGTKTWGHKRIDHVFIRPALGATTTMALSSSGLHLRHLYHDYVHIRGLWLWWGQEQVQWLCPNLPEPVIDHVQNVACDGDELLPAKAFSQCSDVKGCRAAFEFLNSKTGLSRNFRQSFFAFRLEVGRHRVCHMWFI